MLQLNECAPPLNLSAKSIDRNQGQDERITYLKEKQEQQHTVGLSVAQRRLHGCDSVGKILTPKEQGFEIRYSEPTKPGEDTVLESHQALGGRNRRISDDHWPNSPANQ